MQKDKYGRSPTYIVWVNMRQRCGNPNSPRYANYGGRGIKVCEEWQNSYNAFKKYIGEKPPNYSLDRIDNDGDYEPGNVRWATMKEQRSNQRWPRKRSNTISGTTGVYRLRNKWVAVFFKDGKKYYLGMFSDKTEAINARNQKAL